jgi:flagellar biosynthesis protein FlhF
MNVKKFLGENSRATLRSVKQELGDDAVILSSRQVAGGFEMMAMAQRDVASLAQPSARNPALNTGANADAAVSGPQPFMEYAIKRAGGMRAPEKSESAAPAQSLAKAAAKAPAAAQARPADDDLMSELKSVRSLLEGQLASLAWSDSARRAPLRMKLAGQLLSAGYSPGLVRAVTARLPDDFTAEQAAKWICTVLETNLRQAPADELIDRGGVYALVGPTGVGKTTTTAKLAARYVMKYGAQKLGLISADSYRIGAQDQLRIYGRILGVPVHAVQDAAELHATLAALRDKHLVLIDTIGVGQRDPRVAEQVALLGAPAIKRLLVLNAACQAETLEDVVRAYVGPAGIKSLAGCCLGKLDEAVKPGGVLDTAMRHRLPVHYVSNGQRVPEDLELPNAAKLVQQSLSSTSCGAFALSDDETLLMLASRQSPEKVGHA